MKNGYFNGKVIWVLGASSGIGRAMALRFSRAGAKVIASARNVEALEALRLEADGEIQVLPCDVKTEQGREEALRRLKELTPSIDIFVYSAGLSQRSWALDTNLETTRTLMEVNFFSAVHLSTGLIHQNLLGKRGQLVMISSVVGFVGTPKRSSYAATKHALHGYFNTLRAELKDRGIGVTILCPGYIETGIELRSLLGDGSPQNKEDVNRSKSFTPEQFAQEALEAISRRKLEAYIGGAETMAIYLQRFFPGLTARIAHRFAPKTEDETSAK